MWKKDLGQECIAKKKGREVIAPKQSVAEMMLFTKSHFLFFLGTQIRSCAFLALGD